MNIECSLYVLFEPGQTQQKRVRKLRGVIFEPLNTEQIQTDGRKQRKRGKWKHQWDQFVCVGFFAVCVEWGRNADKKEGHPAKEDYDRKKDAIDITGGKRKNRKAEKTKKAEEILSTAREKNRIFDRSTSEKEKIKSDLRDLCVDCN
ncbi:uncharacterized protein MONOS_12838 [Monocercomonoides exilis]|uniref:uncharacterized protein n=1 Tax=Monocercomonoides exilis TaxID=2049356 RepID=UPI00355A020B|nr:hypothetical protein MONOS_12838 [Monocercomonoides exilis]|eukprot:MONOS_12838.1-p1 / transcript=MONOS_12838.1 / gene=MONOS_12838 / organism=Monocercomonoides_exilis_PA203 / gene_product=unspecified product / transcript_product=unspecified product / location=Mono_scaffold00740:24562-25438(+) / protein_length=147 / sequence_SO=supercontig / SO=protein_coding / is_pseudo=false